MAAFTTEQITPKYHAALVAWQKKNFPELGFLEQNWSKYYAQTPFQLFAKIGHAPTDAISHGRMAGRPRFEQAGEMTGNMFYIARELIQAQASSELGSIQQHRLTLDEAPTDQMKMAILRIMAEELRHGYQMFWVFDHDRSWKKLGHPDVGQQAMDEVLAIEVGTHGFDAFNIPFVHFLDNVVFATVIDLVGKYQLEMQKVFSYAPMARSIGPILSEEGFHIGSGRGFLRELAIAATNDKGRYSIDDIQRTLNLWITRGIEMFGHEHGGETSIAFGFKDRNNRTAQTEYYNEVREIVTGVNVGIVQAKIRDLPPADARPLIREVQEHDTTIRGVSPRDLLFLPDVKFFRSRGLEELRFQPYDVHGNLMKVSGAEYAAYLETQLPEAFTKSEEFARYREALLARERPSA